MAGGIGYLINMIAMFYYDKLPQKNNEYGKPTKK
jgi:hypothetical protein